MFNYWLIDWISFVWQVMDSQYRKAKIMAFIESLTKPVRQLYGAISVFNETHFPICPTLGVPSFLTFRSHILSRLSYNGQVISLEKILNRYFYGTFNPALARGTAGGYEIYILSNEIPAVKALFQYSENIPLLLYSINDYVPPPSGTAPEGTAQSPGPLYLYSIMDYLDVAHFTVYIPNSYPYSQQELRAIVDEYKIAGKNYNIVMY